MHNHCSSQVEQGTSQEQEQEQPRYNQDFVTMIPTRLLAVLGLVLSLYAVYVEHKLTHRSSHSSSSSSSLVVDEEPFQALCDIEAIGASCR